VNYFKHDQNLKTLILNLETQELNTNKMKTKYDFFFLKRKKKSKKERKKEREIPISILTVKFLQGGRKCEGILCVVIIR
jgi:hypothetical protein